VRYPVGQKRLTNEKIVRAAGRLFRKHGYAATGVDAVMASAHLTAGGFYSHFRSKEDLLAATLDAVFQDARQDRPQVLNELKGRAWLRAFVEFYLSREHRKRIDSGCPIPALAAEVARIGGKPREVFEGHLTRLIDAIARQFDAENPDREGAIASMALCIGGITMARAVGNHELCEEILAASRSAALVEIGS
jgi:TetR/AcrR family transcriptional repressor of nem operon